MTTAPMNTVSPYTHTRPAANASESNQTQNGQASNITSNDFLTLLVTEMKNQDPTAQTDPNQYINQLVQVNSLQQLIEINQNLSSALGYAIAGGAAPHTAKPVSTAPGSPAQAAGEGSRLIAVPASPVSVTSGALGIPDSIPAANRIAHAMSGRK